MTDARVDQARDTDVTGVTKAREGAGVALSRNVDWVELDIVREMAVTMVLERAEAGVTLAMVGCAMMRGVVVEGEGIWLRLGEIRPGIWL